jgi:predicted nuclease with TOPRIM domain
MTNLKDQIEENIKKERERLEKLRQKENEDTDQARKRFDDIRPKLDELSHTMDKYSLKVGYAKGPYAEVIAVVELYDIDETWVAAWHVGTTASDPVHDWEVVYNPHGVETQHEWFANSDDLLEYLMGSIAERIVEMEAEER